MQSSNTMNLILHVLLNVPLKSCLHLLETAHNPACELSRVNNCLELSLRGFPLQVPTLMSKSHGNKMEYFDYLESIGFNTSLHVVERGQIKQYANAALDDPAKRNAKAHVLFVGDCMARQSFEAYLRNLPESITLTT